MNVRRVPLELHRESVAFKSQQDWPEALPQTNLSPFKMLHKYSFSLFMEEILRIGEGRAEKMHPPVAASTPPLLPSSLGCLRQLSKTGIQQAEASFVGH